MDAEGSGIQLDPHIYLTLTDHLHFAVDGCVGGCG